MNKIPATDNDRAACARCNDPDFDKGDGVFVKDEGWLCPNCAEHEQADTELFDGERF